MARNFLVSTDCAGIFGSVRKWQDTWGDILSLPNCKGVEMIGWAWSNKLLSDAKNKNITVVGIHGRTAGWREDKSFYGKAILGSLNELFMTNRRLLHYAPQVSYILIHRTTLTSKLINRVIKDKDQIPMLMIENVMAEHDFEKTIQMVRELRGEGVNAGMMFDIVHFLRQGYFKAPQMSEFERLVTAMYTLSQEDFPRNIHFPIGTYENDSLPLSQLTDQMWEALAIGVKKVNPDYVVLENQQKRAYSVFLSESNSTIVQKRNYEIISLLTEKHIV